MTEVFVLLIVCSIMGYIYNQLTRPVLTNDGIIKQKNTNVFATIIFIIILCTLVCFSGLRTWMNDTATYMNSFVEKIPDSFSGIKSVDWAIGANPLFNIYQIFLKSVVSSSKHVFIFITSCIVTTSFIIFLKRYSINFGYSIFMFVAFGVFSFTMAAMKQTFATAIAIWALPEFLKGKKFKAAIIIFLAMLIHPYVTIFFVVFFASKSIWDKKTLFMIVIALLVSLFYETFLSAVLNLTSSIGDEFELEYFTTGGVNVLRIAVYLVTPILSYVYRKPIQKKADDMSLVAINLSIVSAIFMALASMGGAFIFGRMACFFDVFQCLALPVIFKYGIKTRNERILVGIISIICFCYYYYSAYEKYLIWNTDCFYDHISFLEMLKSW